MIELGLYAGIILAICGVVSFYSPLLRLLFFAIALSSGYTDAALLFVFIWMLDENGSLDSVRDND